MLVPPSPLPPAQVMDFLGSAAFSQAVQALDIASGALVCLKIIKNNKDYFDQSLDEVKLLRYVNAADPLDQYGVLRLYDFFYYKVWGLKRNSHYCYLDIKLALQLLCCLLQRLSPPVEVAWWG